MSDCKLVDTTGRCSTDNRYSLKRDMSGGVAWKESQLKMILGQVIDFEGKCEGESQDPESGTFVMYSPKCFRMSTPLKKTKKHQEKGSKKKEHFS